MFSLAHLESCRMQVFCIPPSFITSVGHIKVRGWPLSLVLVSLMRLNWTHLQGGANDERSATRLRPENL